MANKYVASTFLQAEDSQIYAIFGWSQREKIKINEKSWLNILEILIHEHSLDKAYQIYQQISNLPITQKVSLELNNYQKDSLILLANQNLTLLGKGLKSIVNQDQEINLTHLSRETYQVLTYFFEQVNCPEYQPIESPEKFKQIVELMSEIGIVSPAIGSIEWGDFRRTVPMCHACGFTRATPIDRYYLQKFVREINDKVVGDVLEIGAVPKDKEFYDFSDRKSYKVLNLEPGIGVDLVGDAHDLSLIEPESLDSIIIFNVLEHCYAPWQVVQNIHTWLKPGGKCFCLVPSAQRLHDRPADYWRPLPDGISLLFKGFSQKQMYVYGNPLSVIAIFHGVATEELTPEELDVFHPDYPVLTCIVAEK